MKDKIIILILYSCFCFFQSCSDDTIQIGKEAEEVEVSFLPKSSGDTYGDHTEIETRLNEIDVVVCKDGKYQYHRPTWSSGQGYKTTLKIDTGLTLHFVVNSRHVLKAMEDNGLRNDKDWETEVRPALIDNDPARLAKANAALPMWGIIENQDIVEGQTYNLGTVALLRSVASVDVLVQTSGEGSSFELEEVYLCYIPSAGLIVPDKNNVENGLSITPEMPAGSKCVEHIKVKTNSNSLLSSLFLYENDATGTETVDGKRRTRLVIAGVLNGKVSFYPLDFRNGETWLKIFRNHKYIFQIPEVSGYGYDSFEEAVDAAPVVMDYKIIDWEHKEGENIVVDGPYFLSLSHKEVILGPSEGAIFSIDLSTNVEKDKVGFSFDEGVSFSTLDYETGSDVVSGIESDIFRVELLQKNNEISALLFTARKNWQEGKDTQKVILTAGRIRFPIVITQSSSDNPEWIEGGNTNMN